MIGLADCNNFFVSCERSRNHTLKGIPVVVLSNNDGCVVARSNEAKALGVRMGQPAFELKNEIMSGKLTALSGNHLLYRDISLKVHDIFRRFAPETIDYSVDEAFLNVDGIPISELHGIGEAIAASALEELDIPVTIGFAPSKTLAKIVTDSCKHAGKSVDVLTNDPELIGTFLRSTKIGDLWGIGRRLAKRLYLAGVYTAADLASKDRIWVRGLMGVNGERTWRELHGEHCIELGHVDRPLQDSISETRTFPEDIDDFDYIQARIAIYTADCAKKLRRMKGVAGAVTVFLSTNPFNLELPRLHPSATHTFKEPVSDTIVLVKTANKLLESIFNPSIPYKRGGVILTSISPDMMMDSVFSSDEEITRRTAKKKLMRIVDSLNPVAGDAKIKLASQLTSGHPGHNDGYSSSFQAPSK